jgi:hypothetical protein
LRQLSIALSSWVVIKFLAYQAVVPFAPVPEPFGRLVSAGGAVLYTLLTLGDGLVFLLAILLAARTYVHGSQKA